MPLIRTTFIYASLVIGTLIAPMTSEAQSSLINGPSLGFTPDSAGGTIWPIIGIPGASKLGTHLAFDTGIRSAVISPKQDYAIAIHTEDGQVSLVDLTAGTLSVNPITDAHPGGDVIAISPSGSAAAVYDDAAKTVQVIGGLPLTPGVIGVFDASSISGHGVSVAISDDGTVALLKSIADGGASLWVMDSTGALSRLLVDRPSAAAFLPNRHDAIVTDDASPSALLIMDVDRAGTQVPLVSGLEGMNTFSSVSVSDDGTQAFLADINAGAVAVVDLTTLKANVLSCLCRPTGFYRLKGNSIFRLNEPSRAPVMVLDGSSAEPRIVVIPPLPGDGTGVLPARRPAGRPSPSRTPAKYE